MTELCCDVCLESQPIQDDIQYYPYKLCKNCKAKVKSCYVHRPHLEESSNRILLSFLNDDDVTLALDHCNGIYERVWSKGGRVHKDNDLPAVTEYSNGLPDLQMWVCNGKLHRDGDNPALIRYRNGTVIREQWWKDGKMHREGDLPVCIENDVDNRYYIEGWYRMGKLYRESDLPSVKRTFLREFPTQQNVYDYVMANLYIPKNISL